MMTFGSWFYFERTLSIHSIYSFRREAFYWLAVLFTFILGTSVGDQISEDGKLGYWGCLVLVFGIIMLDLLINEVLKRVLKPPPTWIAILAFWIAYILTRPLGASIGDLLTADHYPTFDPTTCSPVNTT
jgi:uncharacterized membrane-anchored protein